MSNGRCQSQLCQTGQRGAENGKSQYPLHSTAARPRQGETDPYLFGAAGIMGRFEAYQFIHEAPKGTLFYRLKLSPDPATEDVRRDLNMQKLTRSMMRNLEKRLKTAIPWAAALHDDHTNIRHVHILAAIPRPYTRMSSSFSSKKQHSSLFHSGASLIEERRGSLAGACSPQPMKTGSTRTTRLSSGKMTETPLPRLMVRGVRPAPTHTSCTCPRCHFSQLHTGQRGSHQCMSCGVMLHKKQELSLQRRKGREWERSL